MDDLLDNDEPLNDDLLNDELILYFKLPKSLLRRIQRVLKFEKELDFKFNHFIHCVANGYIGEPFKIKNRDQSHQVSNKAMKSIGVKLPTTRCKALTKLVELIIIKLINVKNLFLNRNNGFNFYLNGLSDVEHILIGIYFLKKCYEQTKEYLSLYDLQEKSGLCLNISEFSSESTAITHPLGASQSLSSTKTLDKEDNEIDLRFEKLNPSKCEPLVRLFINECRIVDSRKIILNKDLFHYFLSYCKTKKIVHQLKNESTFSKIVNGLNLFRKSRSKNLSGYYAKLKILPLYLKHFNDNHQVSSIRH